MPKLLSAERAILLLAKKMRRESLARRWSHPANECSEYEELGLWEGDYAEDVVEYLESVLNRCGAVPPKLRPKAGQFDVPRELRSR